MMDTYSTQKLLKENPQRPNYINILFLLTNRTPFQQTSGEIIISTSKVRYNIIMLFIKLKSCDTPNNLQWKLYQSFMQVQVGYIRLKIKYYRCVITVFLFKLYQVALRTYKKLSCCNISQCGQSDIYSNIIL